MKKVSFLQGVMVAVVFSICGGALFALLMPLLGDYVATRLLIAIISFCYIVYWVKCSGIRTGRITTVISWCLCSSVAWFCITSLWTYVLVHAGMIWLVRAFYWHKSMLSALLDMGLVGCGVIAAIAAAIHSGNMLLSLWCFFLVQAWLPFIPLRWGRSTARYPVQENDRFQAAYHNAEMALRRIASIN